MVCSSCNGSSLFVILEKHVMPQTIRFFETSMVLLIEENTFQNFSCDSNIYGLSTLKRVGI